MKKSGVYLWMVVIAQALLLLVAVNARSGHSRGHEARIKCAFADVNGGIKTTLGIFKENCGRFPTAEERLKILVEPPKDGSLMGWRGPYFDPAEIPKDPWGHEYVYRFPAIYSTNGYDLYSCGPDGISNTGDDIGNWDKPITAPAITIVYRETLSDRVSRWLFFWPLLVPILFAARLAAGVLSQRIGVFMSENPLADRVWLWMSLGAVFIWLFTFPQL